MAYPGVVPHPHRPRAPPVEHRLLVRLIRSEIGGAVHLALLAVAVLSAVFAGLHVTAALADVHVLPLAEVVPANYVGMVPGTTLFLSLLTLGILRI